MTWIHPSIASHRLNVIPSSRPIHQKVRCLHSDKQRIIQAEIDKLLTTGFIREVEYPDWLENVVVVPKKDEKWQVCVSSTNLNDVCPNDSFLFPWIDQIIDANVMHEMFSFIYVLFRYHQIPMFQPDEENAVFVTPHGLYCYKVIPFELKNVGTTYQRLMTKIFKPLINGTVEVYIDDIVVKNPRQTRPTPGRNISPNADVQHEA